jgi:hypothetical protein
MDYLDTSVYHDTMHGLHHILCVQQLSRKPPRARIDRQKSSTERSDTQPCITTDPVLTRRVDLFGSGCHSLGAGMQYVWSVGAYFSDPESNNVPYRGIVLDSGRQERTSSDVGWTEVYQLLLDLNIESC